MTARLPAPLLVLALACAPRYLPGSDIRDTPDTRAIATVLETYRQAMERRDPGAVLDLVAPDYFDESADEIDRAGLEKRLNDLKDLSTLRLQLSVRGIEVQGNQGQAEVYFDQYYRVNTPNGPVTRHDADVHRMKFKRIGSGWKITAGL